MRRTLMAQRWWPRAALLFTDIKKRALPFRRARGKELGWAQLAWGARTFMVMICPM